MKFEPPDSAGPASIGFALARRTCLPVEPIELDHTGHSRSHSAANEMSGRRPCDLAPETPPRTRSPALLAACCADQKGRRTGVLLIRSDEPNGNFGFFDRFLILAGAVGRIIKRASSCRHAALSCWFSSARSLATGTGTQWFHRKKPLRLPRRPSRAVRPACRTRLQNRQCERKATKRAVSSRRYPRRIFFTADVRLS